MGGKISTTFPLKLHNSKVILRSYSPFLIFLTFNNLASLKQLVTRQKTVQIWVKGSYLVHMMHF